MARWSLTYCTYKHIDITHTYRKLDSLSRWLGIWDWRSLRCLRLFSDDCAASTSEAPSSSFASLMNVMVELSITLWRANSPIIRCFSSSEFDYREDVSSFSQQQILFNFGIYVLIQNFYLPIGITLNINQYDRTLFLFISHPFE